MKLFLPTIVVLSVSVALPARAADIKLQVSNGRITLQARDATVREILTEWARVGQVKIVNAEKMAGMPVTIELQDVPEAQALGILLRSVSGYMAAPRVDPVRTASIYDRIVIMAAPRATTVTASSTSAPQQTPPFQQFRTMPNPAMLDDQDETAEPPTFPGGMPPGFVNGPRGVGQQQPGGVPGTIPQGAPGTLSPMPTQATPAQPGTGAPGTVTQPPKKPGGPGSGN
jgi:hypothetical protein